MNRIYILLILIFCLSCTESTNEYNLRCFIDALNKKDAAGIDAFLTSDFKYISDSDTRNKEECIEGILNQDTSWHAEIIKLSESKNIIKTKCNLTNYEMRVLGMKPLKREREYYFDENHRIREIRLVSFISLPEHEKFDKYFQIWALLYYPDMAKQLTNKRDNGEDFSEEKYFLLIKLKQDGLFMLDSAQAYYGKQMLAKEKERRRIESLPPASLNEDIFVKIIATIRSISVSKDIDYPNANPKIKKQLMEEAFIKNGYNYSNTLHYVAEYGFMYGDLPYIMVLLTPVPDLNQNIPMESIFTDQEIADIEQINKFVGN